MDDDVGAGAAAADSGDGVPGVCGDVAPQRLLSPASDILLS